MKQTLALLVFCIGFNIHAVDKQYKKKKQETSFITRHACKCLLTVFSLAYWMPMFRACNDYRNARYEMRVFGKQLGVEGDLADICSQVDREIIAGFSSEVVKATCCTIFAFIVGSYLDRKLHNDIDDFEQEEDHLNDA